MVSAILSPTDNAKCILPNFLCNGSNTCLQPTQMCDGVADCLDGSDEGLGCDDKLCLKDPNLCQQICYNSPLGFVCSCSDNFKLQADKRTCSRM